MKSDSNNTRSGCVHAESARPTNAASKRPEQVSRRDATSALSVGLFGALASACVAQEARVGVAGDALQSSSFVIDFVRDCGADPTGTADCADAFDVAYNMLSTLSTSPTYAAANALRLVMPPGVYRLASPPTVAVWNFSNKTTALEVVGAGIDATILQLNGFDPPALANLYTCRVADLTLFGVRTDGVPDCDCGWLIGNILGEATFERIRCFNLKANRSALWIDSVNLLVSLHDCQAVCCSSQSAGFGVLRVNAFNVAEVRNCVCADVGTMNGVIQDGTKLAGNQAWLRISTSSAFSGSWAELAVRQCFFDENCMRSLDILGDADSPLRTVILENVFAYPPIQQGAVAAVSVENASFLSATGVSDTGFDNQSAAAALRLVNVQSSSLRSLTVNPSAPSNYLIADGACGVVRISDSPTLLASNIMSRARLTEVEEHFFGVVAASTCARIDTPLLANTTCRIEAMVDLCSSTSTMSTASLRAVAVYKNANGVLTFPSAITGSANPMNSMTAAFLSSTPITSELNDGDDTPSAACWSVAGSSMRLSISNRDQTNDAYYQAKVTRKVYAPAV